MDNHTHSDTSRVYHNGGYKAPPATGPVDCDGNESAQLLFDPYERPRRYCLCPVATEDPGAEPEAAGVLDGSIGAAAEDMEPVEPLPLVEDVAGCEDVLDLEEPVMWGLAWRNTALVYGRDDPYTGRKFLSFFSSAEQARAFYSRYGLLRLVYC